MALLDEWVEKAEADFETAVDINRRRKLPLPDSVCYHCQQCIEKYLKAYLLAQGAVPPRTHELVLLLRQCAGYDAALSRLLSAILILDPYSVAIRYPGTSATVPESKIAVKTMRQLRKILRGKLGL